ncbi:MAG: nucleoside monophosphate kinase [Mycobacterium sp.]|nr:nucleoside monophosphate kinase [Mycobacterium sp.]
MHTAAVPEIRETHTGVVALVGDRAYKVKKPVTTDFLDFSTTARREQACEREVRLNSRLSADSYLGIAHLSSVDGGDPEPVIVMRRYPDRYRLSSLVRGGADERRLRDQLRAVAQVLARFHADARRGRDVDADGTVAAVTARWTENLDELQRFGDMVDQQVVGEVRRLATAYLAGRAVLIATRLADRRIVDGHADLLADDIFCQPDGPALLDCLDFDDRLRHVDGVDDAAFLAMDLEFLGARELGDHFMAEYQRAAADPAPESLVDFYIAYRAVVRAKVDCIRFGQGVSGARADARRHLDIALSHLRHGAVRLILVGGGPGTGKTTLARALAQNLGAQVISTDDVRRELQRTGVLSGEAGALDTGLYAPENVAVVYDTVLRQAHVSLSRGRSVILDGTWRDARQRERARDLAQQLSTGLIELSCTTELSEAKARIAARTASSSDATPQIAEAITDGPGWQGAHPINTAQPLADSVAEAQQICCVAI